MHPAALDWVARWAPHDAVSALDVGGRDINGHPGPLFAEGTTWEVVDLHEGPRVTWVGDVLDYRGGPFDVVCCLEVAEHTADWPAILTHCAGLLRRSEGLFIFTAAGPGRAPHSAVDGGPVRPGEHYANVDPDELGDVLDSLFAHHVVDTLGDDVRAAAWRRERP